MPLIIISMAACTSDREPSGEELVEIVDIDDAILGDWWDVNSPPGKPYFIRLEKGGVLLEGTYDTFGRRPSAWQAARIHLIKQESLIVDQSGYGTCAYYVRLSGETSNPLTMYWRADRGEPDAIPFKDAIGGELTRNPPCPERVWQRLADGN